MTRETMKSEIEKRLNDRSWDRMIADSVTERVNKRHEKESFFSMVGSLAVAAVSVIVFIFFPVNTEKNSILTASSYSSSDILSTGYGSSDETLSSEMDLIINEAYPMR